MSSSSSNAYQAHHHYLELDTAFTTPHETPVNEQVLITTHRSELAPVKVAADLQRDAGIHGFARTGQQHDAQYMVQHSRRHVPQSMAAASQHALWQTG